MEAEVDLQSASRETLLAVIAELRRRVEELEALLSSRGTTAGMPGNKPSVKRHQPERGWQWGVSALGSTS